MLTKSNLCERPDPRRILQGGAIAAACGLLLGAIAHPDLNDHQLQGPQILMAGGGDRGDPRVGDPGIGAYGGAVPEYVLGTDWVRPQVQQAAWSADDAQAAGRDASDYEPQTSPVIYDDPERMPMTRAAWRDEPREPTSYPSARGAPYLDSDLPPPPDGPMDDEPLADDPG